MHGEETNVRRKAAQSPRQNSMVLYLKMGKTCGVIFKDGENMRGYVTVE